MENKVTNINNCCFIQQFASNSALNYMRRRRRRRRCQRRRKRRIYANAFGFGFSAALRWGFDIWLLPAFRPKTLMSAFILQQSNNCMKVCVWVCG